MWVTQTDVAVIRQKKGVETGFDVDPELAQPSSADARAGRDGGTHAGNPAKAEHRLVVHRVRRGNGARNGGGDMYRGTAVTGGSAGWNADGVAGLWANAPRYDSGLGEVMDALPPLGFRSGECESMPRGQGWRRTAAEAELRLTLPSGSRASPAVAVRISRASEPGSEDEQGRIRRRI